MKRCQSTLLRTGTRDGSQKTHKVEMTYFHVKDRTIFQINITDILSKLFLSRALDIATFEFFEHFVSLNCKDTTI